MAIPEEIGFLYRVLSAIRINLKDFVLVGGFASYLYQFHERAKPTALSPLLTYDIDLASAGKISVRGGKSRRIGVRSIFLAFSLLSSKFC